MSGLLTTRATTPNAGVLARLAERWRSAGLFLACFGVDGSLTWFDSQMPRFISLCLTEETSISRLIRELSDIVPTTRINFPGPFAGVAVSLIPVARRRKVISWIAVLTRSGAISPTESLARAAQKACLDVQGLLIQTQRVPEIPAAYLAPLVDLLEQMHDDMHRGSAQQNEISSVTEQLTSVYEEISLLYKISSGMRFSQKAETFLETVCGELQDIGNMRSVGVALAKSSEDGEATLTGEVVLVGTDGHASAELIGAIGPSLLASLSSAETRIHNDLAAEGAGENVLKVTKRILCVPLVRDRRPLGVLFALDKADSSEFTSVDQKLLNNVGNQCSIFLENAALYSDMQDLFMGVLHALTRSIDAKDAYTRGHSQRVAELSRDLARKIGLPEEQCERVYLSGLLHDVGKIGVPESVLTKPGRLTDAEFDAIKKHPEIGGQILGNIKQLADIIPGVLYHHERWDGRGYPYNLKEENIPLIGRIICVADSFDAMSSTRTYRPALPLDTVLAEISRCAGAQFDPTLAKAFVTLNFDHYKKSVAEQMVLPKPKAEEGAAQEAKAEEPKKFDPKKEGAAS